MGDTQTRSSESRPLRRSRNSGAEIKAPESDYQLEGGSAQVRDIVWIDPCVSAYYLGRSDSSEVPASPI